VSGRSCRDRKCISIVRQARSARQPATSSCANIACSAEGAIHAAIILRTEAANLGISDCLIDGSDRSTAMM